MEVIYLFIIYYSLKKSFFYPSYLHKKYVKSCLICQLQKTTRIKSQAESILPDSLLAPNEKLKLDIFGPLPETYKGNKYILSMQDRLTRYTLLVPLQNKSTNSIIGSNDRSLHSHLRSPINNSFGPRV